MKQRGLWLVLAGALVASGNAFADDSGGDWMVRVRAVHVNLNDGNVATPTLAGAGINSINVGVQDKTIPEVDISYFFTQNISAELILTYPQKHDVTVDGITIGSLKELPPTLLAQYHFMPNAAVNPYVGVGLNYTRFSSVNLSTQALNLGNLPVTTSSNSIGPALQIGADIPITGNMSFNIDVKKIWMKTDVNVDAANVHGAVDLNPLLIGVGLGWKF